MINDRKFSGEKDERRDLLSNFLTANDEFSDDGEQRLGEVELIGTWSGLGLSACLFKLLPFRKHVHVLHCRTRGENTLASMGGRLIPAA